MKFASKLITFTVFTLVLSFRVAASFSDISPSNEYYDAITYLEEVGIVSGYSDGTFKPDHSINRAETMKLLVEGMGINPDEDTYKNCFIDVTTAWYAKYVCYAKKEGWVRGYDDGSFRPANLINRVEATKMVINTQGFSGETSSGSVSLSYSDTDSSQWYVPYIEAGQSLNLFVDSGDYFYPANEMRRGYLSEMIFRSIVINEMEATSFTDSLKEDFLSEDTGAYVLELPFRDDFHCFLSENEDLAECEDYFEDSSPVCPRYFNPVCGEDGLFYPSACWAEQFGTEMDFYGYCPALETFVEDMWLTRKGDGSSTLVPEPNIEFVYSGGTSELETWLRSTLWEDTENYKIMDFFFSQDYYSEAENSNKYHIPDYTSDDVLLPVIDYEAKLLLVFVTYDEAYSEENLLDWTEIYGSYMNNYLVQKMDVAAPIQYEISPVVILPPDGVEAITASHLFYTTSEKELIYEAALEQVEGDNYDVFAVSPIGFDSNGGYYTTWEGMAFIVAAMIPITTYSETNQEEGLNALIAFQAAFLTLSHEVLHALGLRWDHVPMGYGTAFLDWTGLKTDLITGDIETEEMSVCDFLGESPDYYSVELPVELQINVGEEPSWAILEESSSGNCVTGLENNVRLKDYDADEVYEIMYKNNLIGVELQRTLGWVDIDGDGIAELEDENAYGGWQDFQYDSYEIDYEVDELSTFVALGEEEIDDCIFEQIRLEDGTEGMTPLSCSAFYPATLHLYEEVNYYWFSEGSDYGTVLIPVIN